MNQQLMMQSTSLQPVYSWRIALPALLLSWAWILFLYRDTGLAMVTIWYRSETFAHGFVVPPIALWLIWRRRHDLALLVPRPAPILLLPVAGLALMWLLGDLVAVNSVTQLAFTALLVFAVPAVLGLQVARAIFFPLAFMFFAVPIGDFMLPQLMDWTAYFTIAALRLSGVPVYREGLQFVIPSGNWSVVEACSGVRYLIASVTVGTLFAYLNYRSTKRRVLFVIVSILVPIVANWMRAYMIVMLGHLSGNKIAVGVDHLIYGWVFFGVVIMLMFVIGARWSEPEPQGGERAAQLPINLSINEDEPISVRPEPVEGPIGFDKLSPNGVMNYGIPNKQSSPSSTKAFWVVTACLVAIIALPMGARLAMARSAGLGLPVLVAPVAFNSGWQAADAATMAFKPVFKNPSVEFNSAYANGGPPVGLYLGYYRDQDYDRKLVSSSNALVTSTDHTWSHVAGGARQVMFGPQRAAVRTAELRRLSAAPPGKSGRLVVWQIYWINGTLTANDYLAKIYAAAYRLLGRGDESAVIIMYVEKDHPGGADVALASFAQANYGAIDALLRQAADSK